MILISSDATPQALSEHRSHPASAADGYLLMPFQMDDLLGQIQSLLSLAGAELPPLPPIDETLLPLVRPTRCSLYDSAFHREYRGRHRSKHAASLSRSRDYAVTRLHA